MGKGWVGEKMPLIVQNAPKETEVSAREGQRGGKKKKIKKKRTKLDLGGFFF